MPHLPRARERFRAAVALQKFHLVNAKIEQRPLVLPESVTLHDALERVLRLPAVGSKRYLTNKVDRSVTGLVAQQPSVGPLHTPLADCAVTALSYFSTRGAAVAVGEQPIKGLIGKTIVGYQAIDNVAMSKRVSELSHYDGDEAPIAIV